MYIRRVELVNVKPFKQVELDFCPDGESYAGWSVITGDNGSGKTAFLRAICLAVVGLDNIRTLAPDLAGWIAQTESSARISVEIRPDHEFDKTKRGGYPVQGTFWAEVKFDNTDGITDASPADVRRNKKQGALNGPWQAVTPGWFMLAYGPFRRLYGSSSDAQRLMMLPGRVPRLATLFKEDATLGEAEEWVKQLMFRKLEKRPFETEALDGVRLLLADNFLREDMQLEKIDSDGIWLKDSHGNLMTLADMSEGYRSAIAMLVDIFRNMVEIYGPHGLVHQIDGKAVIARPGVVLIDEVDAHLHPAWQREIGFWLKAHFPLVQFIVTTHSPLVCQAADFGRVYHMPSGGTEPFMVASDDFNRIIAGKPDQILLGPAFGLDHTRSPRAVDGRNRLARLKSKSLAGKLSDGDRREMDELSLFALDLG